MLSYSRTIVRRTSLSKSWSHVKTVSAPLYYNHSHTISTSSSSSSSPSLSIWRRKKELGKEGLIIAKELKRLQSSPVRLDRFMKSHVSRLLKSDLVSVLAEFQRQGLVFLSMKVYFHILSFFLIIFIRLLVFICIILLPIIHNYKLVKDLFKISQLID